MNEKTIVLAIVAILAVAAVGVGIYYVYGNDEDPATMSFLIEDGINEPFWIKGEGDDGVTAFINACEKYDVDLETSDSSFGVLVNRIAGLEAVEEEGGNWIYWALYVYADGAWEISDVGISGLEFCEGKCAAWVYTGSGAYPSIEP